MTTETFDHWWPVSHDYGLIRSDLERVVDARRRMYDEAGLKITVTELDAPLQDCLALLEPLSPAPTKELYLTTSFGWTGYLANGSRGSDPAIAMKQLALALGTMSLRACATPGRFLYQGVILEVYDTQQAGADQYGYRRSIAAVNDGGRWVFEQSGHPFPFEEIARYDARRKRDRFTKNMLAAYITGLGARPLSDQVLETGGVCSAVLLARPAHGHLPQFTLEQAKALNENGSET